MCIHLHLHTITLNLIISPKPQPHLRGGGASPLELLGLWWGRNMDESVLDELVVELVSAAFRPHQGCNLLTTASLLKADSFKARLMNHVGWRTVDYAIYFLGQRAARVRPHPNPHGIARKNRSASAFSTFLLPNRRAALAPCLYSNMQERQVGTSSIFRRRWFFVVCQTFSSGFRRGGTGQGSNRVYSALRRDCGFRVRV